MGNIQSKGVRYNLDSVKPDIKDTNPSSKYFVVEQFNFRLTGGKNCININGSEYLKSNTPIKIEVLDVNKNPLYIEIAKGPGNGVGFRDGVSIAIAIHVTGSTPVGVGTIYIYGTTNDNHSVIWSHDISINSKISNVSTVRFYTSPILVVEPILSEVPAITPVSETTINTTISTLAVSPIENTNFAQYDSLRNQVYYKIICNDGQFNSQMVDLTIPLTNITLTDGTVIPDGKELKIKSIINKFEALAYAPIIYPEGASQKPVKNVKSCSATLKYTPIHSATGTGKFKSFARIIVKNIRSFSGNVKRIRIFRQSITSDVNRELISDYIVDSDEVVKDLNALSVQKNKMGFFYSQDIITSYWSGMTLEQDSSNIIDGMKISGSPGKVSSPSNKIKLYPNVDYQFTCTVYNNRADQGSLSNLQIYFQSQDLDHTIYEQLTPNGILLGDIKFLPDKNKTFTEHYFSFSIKKEIQGNIDIYPLTDGYTISKISIKPISAFSFSPDIVNFKVPCPISYANEKFTITAELFDINNNNIPATLQIDKFFDTDGTSLL